MGSADDAGDGRGRSQIGDRMRLAALRPHPLLPERRKLRGYGVLSVAIAVSSSALVICLAVWVAS